MDTQCEMQVGGRTIRIIKFEKESRAKRIARAIGDVVVLGDWDEDYPFWMVRRQDADLLVDAGYELAE